MRLTRVFMFFFSIFGYLIKSNCDFIGDIINKQESLERADFYTSGVRICTSSNYTTTRTCTSVLKYIRSSHKCVPTFVYTFHVSIYKHTAIRDQCI